MRNERLKFLLETLVVTIVGAGFVFFAMRFLLQDMDFKLDIPQEEKSLKRPMIPNKDSWDRDWIDTGGEKG